MNELWLAAGLSFWYGILTAISPCPMATNVAAISYIGKSFSQPRLMLLSGLVYSIGRVVAYWLIASVLVSGLSVAPEVSRFLQKNMNQFLGPLLVVVGMFLLEMIVWPTGRGTSMTPLHERLGKSGVLGAFGLGFLFACAFCPVSAGLFFASMLPLAIKHRSVVLVPAAYGLATALPVVLFAFVIAFSTRSLGSLFQKTSRFEWWSRRVTGVLMILVGIYYSLIYIYSVELPR